MTVPHNSWLVFISGSDMYIRRNPQGSGVMKGYCYHSASCFSIAWKHRFHFVQEICRNSTILRHRVGWYLFYFRRCCPKSNLRVEQKVWDWWHFKSTPSCHLINNSHYWYTMHTEQFCTVLKSLICHEVYLY